MTERPNKELALRYYSDDTLNAWWWVPDLRRWQCERNPDFDSTVVWHVGHEAPTEPPVKTCELAGIRFPMPMREAPTLGSTYWHAGTVGAYRLTWHADGDDLLWLGRGVCHATQAAAQAHSEAFLAWNRQAIEGAK